MTSRSPNGDRPQRRDTVAKVARNLDERNAVRRRRTTGTSMPRSHGATSWRVVGIALITVGLLVGPGGVSIFT
jgi:hypothetical protein